jgi:hypothetical protein
VPEWSAVIDGFNVKQHPLPGDHVQMCKFADSEEAGYKRVSYMIKTILKKEFQGKSGGGSTEPNPVPDAQPRHKLLPEPVPSTSLPFETSRLERHQLDAVER